MHGSSSVPKDLVDLINHYGGEIRQTWGVPVEEIQLGIRHGVRKINVDTDSRLAITGAIRKAMADDPGEFDPRSYLKPARAAMQSVIAERMTQFGQAGHAGDYEPRSLADMRDFYAGGRHEGHRGDRELDGVVRRCHPRGGGGGVQVDPWHHERRRDRADLRRRAGRGHALERARQDLVPGRAPLDP
jgi:hypothetical protein